MSYSNITFFFKDNRMSIPDLWKRLNSYTIPSRISIPLSLLGYELIYSKDFYSQEISQDEVIITKDAQDEINIDEKIQDILAKESTKMFMNETHNKINQNKENIFDKQFSNNEITMHISNNFQTNQELFDPNITSRLIPSDSEITICQIKCFCCNKTHTFSLDKFKKLNTKITKDSMEKILSIFPHQSQCTQNIFLSLLNWDEGENFWFSVSNTLRSSNDPLNCLEFIFKENILASLRDPIEISYDSNILSEFFNSLNNIYQMYSKINLHEILKYSVISYSSFQFCSSNSYENRLFLFIQSLFGWRFSTQKNLIKSNRTKLNIAHCHYCNTLNNFQSLYEYLNNYKRYNNLESKMHDTDENIEDNLEIYSSLVNKMIESIVENHRSWCPMRRKIWINNSEEYYTWEYLIRLLSNIPRKTETNSSKIHQDFSYYSYKNEAFNYINNSISQIIKHRNQVKNLAKRIINHSLHSPINQENNYNNKQNKFKDLDEIEILDDRNNQIITNIKENDIQNLSNINEESISLQKKDENESNKIVNQEIYPIIEKPVEGRKSGKTLNRSIITRIRAQDQEDSITTPNVTNEKAIPIETQASSIPVNGPFIMQNSSNISLSEHIEQKRSSKKISPKRNQGKGKKNKKENERRSYASNNSLKKSQKINKKFKK